MYNKIIHYHIHKTGGTSLNRWLDTLVPSCRARPPERARSLDAEAKPLGDVMQGLRGSVPPHPLARAEFSGDDTRTLEERLTEFRDLGDAWAGCTLLLGRDPWA